MSLVIQEIMPFAIGIAISPMAIAAIILVLFSRKAQKNSLYFLVGWTLGLLLAIVTVLALFTAGFSMMGEDAQSLNFGFINTVFGLLLFVAAFFEWRNRTPKGEEPKIPKWMMAIDEITPGKTLGLAIFLSLLPKNLMLNITSTTTIASSDISAMQKLVAFLIFLLVANLIIAAVVLVYGIFGERAENTLSSWKAWMIRNNSTVLIVLYLFYGFLLVVPQVMDYLL